MKKPVKDWVFFAERDLETDGLPTNEQARKFIEYTKEIKGIISKELELEP